MRADAIDRIAALAHKGRRLAAFHVPQEPGHVYYLDDGQSPPRRVEADPPRREHRALCLESLVGKVLHHSGTTADSCVWCSREGVTALLDDTTRRDQVSLPLKPSAQMALLGVWSAGVVWHEQAALVRLLRTKFPGAFSSDGVVDLFRRLAFRQGQSSEKAVEHGRASLGRRIEAELEGAARVPEEMYVHVPVWEGRQAGIETTVRLLVEIDAAAERIALIPEAGGVEGAWLKAEEELAGRVKGLLGEGTRDTQGGGGVVQVYRGLP